MSPWWHAAISKHRRPHFDSAYHHADRKTVVHVCSDLQILAIQNVTMLLVEGDCVSIL